MNLIDFGTQEQWFRYLLPIGFGWLVISLTLILSLRIWASRLMGIELHIKWHYLFFNTCNLLKKIEDLFEKIVMFLMSLLTIFCLMVMMAILFGVLDKAQIMKLVGAPLVLIGFCAYLIVMYIFSEAQISSILKKWKVSNVSDARKVQIVNCVYLADGVLRYINKNKLQKPSFNDLMFWEIVEDYSKSNPYVLNELFSLEAEAWKDWAERSKKKAVICKNELQI